MLLSWLEFFCRGVENCFLFNNEIDSRILRNLGDRAAFYQFEESLPPYLSATGCSIQGVSC